MFWRKWPLKWQMSFFISLLAFFVIGSLLFFSSIYFKNRSLRGYERIFQNFWQSLEEDNYKSSSSLFRKLQRIFPDEEIYLFSLKGKILHKNTPEKRSLPEEAFFLLKEEYLLFRVGKYYALIYFSTPLWEEDIGFFLLGILLVILLVVGFLLVWNIKVDALFYMLENSARSFLKENRIKPIVYEAKDIIGELVKNFHSLLYLADSYIRGGAPSSSKGGVMSVEKAKKELFYHEIDRLSSLEFALFPARSREGIDAIYFAVVKGSLLYFLALRFSSSRKEEELFYRLFFLKGLFIALAEKEASPQEILEKISSSLPSEVYPALITLDDEKKVFYYKVSPFFLFYKMSQGTLISYPIQEKVEEEDIEEGSIYLLASSSFFQGKDLEKIEEEYLSSLPVEGNVKESLLALLKRISPPGKGFVLAFGRK